MIICRHFTTPDVCIHGCRVGRIAYVDCGPGCTAYDPDPHPEQRTDRALWIDDECDGLGVAVTDE